MSRHGLEPQARPCGHGHIYTRNDWPRQPKDHPPQVFKIAIAGVHHIWFLQRETMPCSRSEYAQDDASSPQGICLVLQIVDSEFEHRITKQASK